MLCRLTLTRPGPRRVPNDLFKGLATKSDIADILSVYSDYFKLNVDDDKPVPEFSPGQKRLNDVFDGRHDFGVENQMLMAPEVLARELGFVGWIPPAFHDKRHPLGVNAWDQPQAFLTGIQLLPMRLHWHQLVGVDAIVERLWSVVPNFRNAGILIGDEVGLGKTAQAIALLAFFNLSITAQLTGKPLPPILGEHDFMS